MVVLATDHRFQRRVRGAARVLPNLDRARFLGRSVASTEPLPLAGFDGPATGPRAMPFRAGARYDAKRPFSLRTEEVHQGQMRGGRLFSGRCDPWPGSRHYLATISRSPRARPFSTGC